MYYISSIASGPSLSQKKHRLSDFKGKEGEVYLVRRSRLIDSDLFSLPQYIFQDGRLRKTGSYSVYISSLD